MEIFYHMSILMSIAYKGRRIFVILLLQVPLGNNRAIKCLLIEKNVFACKFIEITIGRQTVKM